MRAKSFLFVLVSMMLPMVASAETVKADGICYKLNTEDFTAEVYPIDGYYTPSSGKGYGAVFYTGNIVIPSVVSYQDVNFTVTSIGQDAFRESPNLSSVVIPNSVISIGNNSFQDCKKLSSVTIPNSVKTIGDFAFKYCENLSSVTIQSGVTYIGAESFFNCGNITSIAIPNSVTYIGTGAFKGCGLSSVKIPSSVKTIGESIFNATVWYNNQPDGLLYVDNCLIGYKGSVSNDVTILEGTRLIAWGAFGDCKELISVIIPEGIDTIQPYTFNKCTNLTSVSIPSSVTFIREYAFDYCDNITDIICNSTKVPFASHNNAFCSHTKEKATLHVPGSAIEEYKSTSPWNEFKNIVAIEGTQLSKYKLTYMVDGEVYKSYEIKPGSTIIPLEEPTKEGYTFSGWSDIPEEMPAHDVTITGTFIKNPLGKCATPVIDFKDGRLVFDCETEGVEFNYDIQASVSLTGKGNNIPINPSIIVKVYASKEDYTDSDTITKEVQIPASEIMGDANGDGEINAADIVTIVNKIMSSE